MHTACRLARSVRRTRGPRRLSLLAEVADELVVRTVRDTHVALLDRVHVAAAGARGETATLSSGSTAASPGRCTAASVSGCASRRRPRRVADPASARARGRPAAGASSSAVNGLIGDRLVRERPRLAIPMAVRPGGRDVPLDPDGLAAAFPDASDRLVVFLHGLCENESYWDRAARPARHDVRRAAGRRGLDAGPAARQHRAAAARERRRAGRPAPRPGRRVAGGGRADRPGRPLDGRPGHAGGRRGRHRGRPALDRAGHRRRHPRHPPPRRAARPGRRRGSRGLGRLPESAAFGRILDWRSTGVLDLVEGLAEDVPALPHARYRLVAATVTASPRHPVGPWWGTCWCGSPRPTAGPEGRGPVPRRRAAARGAADHFDLLNHPASPRAAALAALTPRRRPARLSTPSRPRQLGRGARSISSRTRAARALERAAR